MPFSSLAKSALRFPLAASAFGVTQLARLLSAGNPETSRAANSDFYASAAAAQAQFDTNSLLFAAYQLGDQAQQAFAGLTLDALTLQLLKPGYLKEAGSAIAKGSADAWGSVATSEARQLTVDQIQNNFTVVNLVNSVDAPAVLSGDGDYPLDEMLENAYALGEYPALWSVEGLGQKYADAYLASGREVRGLFTTGKGAKLPEKSLLMMHAGAGIAFAKRILGLLTPWSSDAEFREALTFFLALVEQNSRPGYKGPALESLGLVTRTWHNRLTEPLARNLALIDAGAAEYFWHGAGRAMYFSPLNFVPGFSPFFTAEQEPPDEIARRNARAGVAWAFTVVNIRQPEITADFLKHKSSEIAGNAAYSNGVLSTLIMAGEMVPQDVYVAGFCSWKPDPADRPLVNLWNENIGVDCADRVANCRRTLKAQGKLGEIFRYHDSEELMAM